jgi:hypothetical protein
MRLGVIPQILTSALPSAGAPAFRMRTPVREPDSSTVSVHECVRLICSRVRSELDGDTDQPLYKAAKRARFNFPFSGLILQFFHLSDGIVRTR